MINYKFIVKNRGEGKTKQLVECLINSLAEGRTCVYVGSYYNYINVKNIYEAVIHEPCPMLFIDSNDRIKETINTNEIDFFTDELTNEMGHIMLSSLVSTWAPKINNPRWYITLDKSAVI